MSGHSKWAQIKRQKGVSDVKRGQAFTKISSVITIAVRQGGGIGDPDQNFKLRLAIEKAREINMPKENIERAIEKGKGGGDKGEGFTEVVYEGFASAGIAVIVEAATDNKLRTAGEIKNVFEKNGGTFGTSGSVSYLFQQKGLITVKKNGKTLDDVFLIVADSGAEDVEDEGVEALVYTKPQELAKVKDNVIKNGLEISSYELTRKPLNVISVTDKDTAQKVIAFIEKLEDLDDVQKVYANFDIPDEIIQQISTSSK